MKRSDLKTNTNNSSYSLEIILGVLTAVMVDLLAPELEDKYYSVLGIASDRSEVK